MKLEETFTSKFFCVIFQLLNIICTIICSYFSELTTLMEMSNYSAICLLFILIFIYYSVFFYYFCVKFVLFHFYLSLSLFCPLYPTFPCFIPHYSHYASHIWPISSLLPIITTITRHILDLPPSFRLLKLPPLYSFYFWSITVIYIILAFFIFIFYCSIFVLLYFTYTSHVYHYFLLYFFFSLFIQLLFIHNSGFTSPSIAFLIFILFF